MGIEIGLLLFDKVKSGQGLTTNERKRPKKTECNPEQLEFHTLGRRDAIGRFDGGRLTSDGGGMLLREVDKGRGLLDRLACLLQPFGPQCAC